jgi:hypothetical protein
LLAAHQPDAARPAETVPRRVLLAASRAWNLLLGHVRLLLFEALHLSFIPTRIETRAEVISKARRNPLGPTSAEEVIFGYKRVQGGFEGTSVGEEAAKEESDVLNKRRKVSTASPAPSSMWQFAELSRGRRYGGYRPLS